jgi:hypothetical protein
MDQQEIEIVRRQTPGELDESSRPTIIPTSVPPSLGELVLEVSGFLAGAQRHLRNDRAASAEQLVVQALDALEALTEAVVAREDDDRRATINARSAGAELQHQRREIDGLRAELARSRADLLETQGELARARALLRGGE